jgi:cytochrome c oxidase assembly protein Cox11
MRAGVQVITLSYTFYETDLPEEQAALPLPGPVAN